MIGIKLAAALAIASVSVSPKTSGVWVSGAAASDVRVSCVTVGADGSKIGYSTIGTPVNGRWSVFMPVSTSGPYKVEPLDKRVEMLKAMQRVDATPENVAWARAATTQPARP